MLAYLSPVLALILCQVSWPVLRSLLRNIIAFVLSPMSCHILVVPFLSLNSALLRPYVLISRYPGLYLSQEPHNMNPALPDLQTGLS